MKSALGTGVSMDSKDISGALGRKCWVFIDQDQLEDCYDILEIEKSDCLCNMLIKGFDQNWSRVSGGPGGQIYLWNYCLRED